ncbi:MAG: exopolysaccharide biosynthesis polyprenyl glycosylphosphotransferase [Thermoanaerobaculia bacterium]
MVLCDSLAILASGLFAFLTWARPVRGQDLALYSELWILLPLFLLGFAQAGLYPGTGLGPVATLRRTSYVSALTFLLLAGLSFALQLPYVYSRVTFAIAFLATLLFVPLFRLAALSLLARTAWWPEAAVVLADEADRAGRIVAALTGAPHLGYSARALVLSRESGQPTRAAEPPHFPDVESALASTGATVAFLDAQSAAESMLDPLQQRFHRVLVVRGFDDLPVEGIRVHNLGGFLGLEYTNNLLDSRNQWFKRALDLGLGSIALILSLPLLLLAILAIEVRSPGPPLFFQERSGRNGRRIRVPKIRTMVPGAEAQLEEALARDPALREEWRQRMKLRDDPRLIPFVGKFLRRFSLDELPQLWSVVAGDMSLVGPRPFPDYHLEKFPERFRELRRRVRPGITGLWQVTVRSEGALERQQSLDSYYIRNWSIWLDIYILARTVGAVLTGRGAY